MAPHPRTIALFDVDGTLTVPRKVRLGPLLPARCPSAETQELNARRPAGGDPGDAGFPSGAAQGEFAMQSGVRRGRALPRTDLKLALGRYGTSLQHVTVGIVGGSDLVKIQEQLGSNGALHGAAARPPRR